VLWTFPAQNRLYHPLTLGLQNLDELNFGVSDFWSYFFPFDRAIAEFERLLDAWVSGQARILVTGRRGRVLQRLDGDEWTTVYQAGRILPFRGVPKIVIQNEPTLA
jgi:hypothetical protein